MTKPTLATAGMLLLLYLASLTSQSSLLLTLIGILTGCLLVNALSAQRVLQHIQIELPPKTRVEEGGRVLESWTVRNSSNGVISEISVRLNKQIWWRAFSVPRQSVVHLPPVPPGPKRGVYPLRHFALTTSHPFGLLRAETFISAAAELIVHPKIPQLDPPSSSGLDTMVGGKKKGQRRKAAGGIFSGIRPYQAGDPLRQVHWKSTAKGLGVMVKTYDEELSGRITLVLDNRSQASGGEDFESAIRLAGGLLFAALDAGDHVHWIELAGGGKMRFTPFSDPESVLDFLSTRQTDSGVNLETSVAEILKRVASRTTMLLVLCARSIQTRKDIEVLAGLGHRMTCYSPQLDSPVDGSGQPMWIGYSADGVPS